MISTLLTEIDDWCGTKPPRPFPPKKGGLRDLLISVAIHNLAAEVSDVKAREQIQSVAANVYASAGKGLVG
jgi:hypothetical protein